MTAPVLWHFSFANYSEKARWALDFKGVAHERREPPAPLLHPLWAWRVGGGRTIPVLDFGDGEVATDTTQIVTALERRHPDPPLLPGDPRDRARAVELDALFTDDLGHDVRKLAMDHIRRHPEYAVRMTVPGAPQAAEPPLALAIAPFHFALRRYFDVNAQTVERAWQRLDAVIDRFHAELSPAGYLAGDRFSIADLSFAAMLSPAVQPPGFPYPARDERSRRVPEVCALLEERGVMEWMEDVYARHRGEWVRVASPA
jgi:glutathione S-transferase